MKSLRHFLSLVACLSLTSTVFGQGEPKKAPPALPKPVDLSHVADIPESDDGLPGAGPFRRADWFRKVWAGQRTTFAKNVEKERGAVVFLGDSITQGWGQRLPTSFPDFKVANRGISGDTTRGVLYRFKEDVLTLAPRAVVLLIGTNDLEEQADPETIAGNLKLMFETFKTFNSQMPVIVCRVMPSSASKKRPKDKITKLNELIAGLVKENAGYQLVDSWTIFANDQGDAKLEEFPDLLHPNDAGYKKFAMALRPVISKAIAVPADNFTPEPGFVSLFNGKDLTGWGYRTNNFDGKLESFEGRYIARDGMLIVNPVAEGRRIQQIWTTQEFPKDFVMRLEFRAAVNADSGIFIRKPQLQCRDYLVAGPYKELKKYKAQDWNEIEVVVKDGVAHCTCNGELLEGALKVPPTGPIGLEGDRGQLEYRRIRLKETP